MAKHKVPIQYVLMYIHATPENLLSAIKMDLLVPVRASTRSILLGASAGGGSDGALCFFF